MEVKRKIIIEIDYLDFEDLKTKLNETAVLAWNRDVFDDKGIAFQKLQTKQGRKELINGKMNMVYPSKMNFDEVR